MFLLGDRVYVWKSSSRFYGMKGKVIDVECGGCWLRFDRVALQAWIQFPYLEKEK